MMNSNFAFLLQQSSLKALLRKYPSPMVSYFPIHLNYNHILDKQRSNHLGLLRRSLFQLTQGEVLAGRGRMAGDRRQCADGQQRCPTKKWGGHSLFS